MIKEIADLLFKHRATNLLNKEARYNVSKEIIQLLRSSMPIEADENNATHLWVDGQAIKCDVCKRTTPDINPCYSRKKKVRWFRYWFDSGGGYDQELDVCEGCWNEYVNWIHNRLAMKEVNSRLCNHCPTLLFNHLIYTKLSC